MSKVSRNAPCPCGSGKKYKKCCLPAERAEAALGRPHEGPQIALSWLADRWADLVNEMVDVRFLGDPDDAAKARLAEHPEKLQGMLHANISEWILAEGELEIDGERRTTMELVLGPDGPPFNAGQRRHLDELMAHSVRLYEIQMVDPGRGLWVQDVVDPDAPHCWIAERAGSRDLVRGQILGARLISGEVISTDSLVFSGALYPIPPTDYPEVLEELRRELDGCHGDALLKRRVFSTVLIAAWLRSLTAPLPDIVDERTGEVLIRGSDVLPSSKSGGRAGMWWW